MQPTRFRAMIPAWIVTMALILSGCGFKGDLYLPGKEEKKDHKPLSTDRKP